MEKINCKICGCDSDRNILEFYTENDDLSYLKSCENCDFQYISPRINESEISDYYNPEYMPHKNHMKTFYDFFYNFSQTISFKWKKWILKKYCSKNLNILDYGSGNNKFSNYINDYHNQCKSYDIYNSSSDIKSLSDLKCNSFNCITLWHSIEHIYSINDTLVKISDLIEDDGYIFIACPNYNAFERQYLNRNWPAYDFPRHLYHFNYNSMEKILSKHKIEIVNSYAMLQDTFFNIFLSKNVTFIYKLFLSFYSFLIVIINKRRASSILYVCKIKT